VHEVDAYHTVPATETAIRARQMLIAGEIDVITFTSSSTVTNLAAAFQGEPLAVNGTKVACIGPKTAETATKAGLKVDILAGKQTIPGLVDAIEEYFRKEI
jgi:uroporphyrinogen III methyltransferase/synthase